MRRTTLLLIFIIALFTLTFSVTAQQGETISIGEIKVGTADPGGASQSYIFNANAGQEVTIEVTALSTGMSLSFTILNQSGALVQAVGNPTQLPSISDNIVFPQAGTYTIQITNNGTARGQFRILLSETGGTQGPPIFLTEGQTFDGTVNPGVDVVYSFSANQATPLTLNVNGLGQQRGPSVTITSEDGRTLALTTGDFTKFAVEIPAGAPGTFTLTLINDHPFGTPINFTVSLAPSGTGTPGPDTGPVGTEEPGSRQPTPTFTPDPNATPILPSSGPCVIATQGQIVNVREGPSTNYDQITTIGAYTIYDVTGRNEDASWFQINAQPEIGWVSRTVIREGGDCSAVAFASYPPLRKSTITGVVFHDLCAVPDGPVTEPPPGCVDDGGGSYRANGIYESEPGISSVNVTLNEGSCPGSGTTLSRVTDSSGRYTFDQLVAGTYCVSIAVTGGNADALIPGGWTAPFVVDGTIQYTVNVGPVETKTVNFGWDYQFAP